MKTYIRLDRIGHWRGTEHNSSVMGMAEETNFEGGVSCYELTADGLADLYHYWYYNASFRLEDTKDFQVTIFSGEEVGMGSDWEVVADVSETIAEVSSKELYEKWVELAGRYYEDEETKASNEKEYIEEHAEELFQVLEGQGVTRKGGEFFMDKGVREHDVYVRSLQGNEARDADELAELVIINSVNQEEYVFPILNNKDELEAEQGLSTTIWLSGVDEELSLDTDEAGLGQALDNVLYQSSLDDFLKSGAMQDVTQQIVDYYENDKEFLYKVPFNQLNIDMRTVLIDEEITRMTKNAFADALTKEDVVNFGKLIGQETNISVGQLNYLQEPMNKAIEKALSDGVLEPQEQQAVQFAFEAIQLSQPQLERSKEQENTKKQQQKNQEMEYEMGM